MFENERQKVVPGSRVAIFQVLKRHIEERSSLAFISQPLDPWCCLHPLPQYFSCFRFLSPWVPTSVLHFSHPSSGLSPLLQLEYIKVQILFFCIDSPWITKVQRHLWLIFRHISFQPVFLHQYSLSSTNISSFTLSLQPASVTGTFPSCPSI